MTDHHSQSAASSAESAASISDSNGPVCKLCGSASRTNTASESSLDIGPESLAIPTCEALWPTPRGQDSYERSNWKTIRKVNEEGGDLTLTRAVKYQNRHGIPGGRCPCRCHRLTYSSADFRVRTYPSQARAQDSKVNARVFGPSTHDSLASYDPDTSSWRTSQLCLDGELDEFLATWPRSGMTRSGIAFQRQPLVPLTGGTGSGLLPTPTTQDASNDGGPSQFKRNSLPLNALVKQWPTPRTSDTNGPGRHGTGGPDLRTAVAEATPVKGQLNPQFVEWLMGFPKDWTVTGPKNGPESRESQPGSRTE